MNTSLRGKKVLIAEDNDTSRDLLTVVLMNYDCKVTSVTNGKEAVEKAKKFKFDIILTDINMPIMGGIEACRIIKERIDRNIPIIAVSATVDRPICIASGMDDFLEKPLDLKKLRRCLVKWVRG